MDLFVYIAVSFTAIVIVSPRHMDSAAFLKATKESDVRAHFLRLKDEEKNDRVNEEANVIEEANEMDNAYRDGDEEGYGHANEMDKEVGGIANKINGNANEMDEYLNETSEEANKIDRNAKRMEQDANDEADGDANEETNEKANTDENAGECGKKGSALPLSGSRITDVTEASYGEFPWQVSLRFGRYGHICGGTLIGNQYVLCAAYCFVQTDNANAYTVRVGEHSLTELDGAQNDFAVAEVHVHDRYNQFKTFNNDIALLKLRSPVDFSGPYAGPACLPTAGKDYRGSQNCIFSGWGLQSVRQGVRQSQTHSDRLQKVTGRIWGAPELLRQYGQHPDHVVGFGEPDRWSACNGDSGGPLVCVNGSGAYDVVGVFSLGPETCSGKPGVFTEVSAYRDWLSAKSGGSIPAPAPAPAPARHQIE